MEYCQSIIRNPKYVRYIKCIRRQNMGTSINHAFCHLKQKLHMFFNLFATNLNTWNTYRGICKKIDTAQKIYVFRKWKWKCAHTHTHKYKRKKTTLKFMCWKKNEISLCSPEFQHENDMNIYNTNVKNSKAFCRARMCVNLRAICI